jgi:N-acetylmuramoyl-L-alanine amidase
LKLFIVFFWFFSLVLLADLKKDLADARVVYIQAVLEGDNQKELAALKKIIEHSKELGLSTALLEKDFDTLDTKIAKSKNLTTNNSEFESLFNESKISSKKEIPQNQQIIPVEKKEALKQKINPDLSNKIIVIDPGHGGKDPGAVGPNGEKEKDTVLQIGYILADILRARGYKVIFTRDDDTFIELQQRTKFANKKDAKIFVSIHANAVPKDKVAYAKGIETYFLSPARDEKSKRIAGIENGADMNEMGFDSKNVFLNVFNRGKIVQSQKLAIDVQRSMISEAKTQNHKVVDGGVREAPFWVLVGAQSAAILVEVGYISHPEESQLLIDKSYQTKLALGIANGISNYFAHNP